MMFLFVCVCFSVLCFKPFFTLIATLEILSINTVGENGC